MRSRSIVTAPFACVMGGSGLKSLDPGELAGERQPGRAEVDVQPVDGDRVVRPVVAAVEHQRTNVVTMSAESREAQRTLRAADRDSRVPQLSAGVGRRFQSTLERYRDAGRIGQLGEPSGEDRGETAGVEAAEVDGDLRGPVLQPVFRGPAQREPLVARPGIDIEHADNRVLRAFQVDRHPLRAHPQPEQTIVERDRGAMDRDSIELAQQGLFGAPSSAGFEQRERLAAFPCQADAQRAVLPPDRRDVRVGEPDGLQHQDAVEQRGQRQPEGNLGNPRDDAPVLAAQLGIGDHQVERPLRPAPGENQIGESHPVGQAQPGEPFLQIRLENAQRDRALGQSPRAEEPQQDRRYDADGEDTESDTGQSTRHRAALAA